MRQIFSKEAKLSINDYVRVRFLIEEEEEVMEEGVIYRYSADGYAVLANTEKMNGCTLGLYVIKSLGEQELCLASQFSYCWDVYVERDLNVVEVASNSDELEFRIIAIQTTTGWKTLSGASMPTVARHTNNFKKPLYETTEIYTGLHGYHAHHGKHFNQPVKAGTKPYRVGVELEVEFDKECDKNEFCKGKSNWFFLEHDGSLNNNGVEIITVPIRPMDAKSLKFWEDLINYLAPKAQSWNSPRCGLHVHIGREILGNTPEEKSETIGKLLYLYHHHLNNTPLNSKVFGRDRAYHELDGKTEVGKAAKLLGESVLKDKDVKERVKKSLTDKSSDDRYYDINLTNRATIEFRKGRGSINTSRICLVVEYCEKMCLFAKQSHWENISYDNFITYMKKNVKVSSPLRRYFEEF